MAKDSGLSALKSILSNPWFYRFFQYSTGYSSARKVFAREYLRAKPGDALLDIGCGPGDIIEHLPEVEYFGFDVNEKYIQAARKRFGNRAEFHCGGISDFSADDLPRVNIAISLGVFHHLNDAEIAQNLQLVKSVLKPGGRFIIFDPCYVVGQSRVAKFIISQDRGKYLKTDDEYRNIAAQFSENAKVSIRHDLYRFPYTVIIIECTN
jgi:SAM-dependent methyltransferase